MSRSGGITGRTEPDERTAKQTTSGPRNSQKPPIPSRSAARCQTRLPRRPEGAAQFLLGQCQTETCCSFLTWRRHSNQTPLVTGLSRINKYHSALPCPIGLVITRELATDVVLAALKPTIRHLSGRMDSLPVCCRFFRTVRDTPSRSTSHPILRQRSTTTDPSSCNLGKATFTNSRRACRRSPRVLQVRERFLRLRNPLS